MEYQLKKYYVIYYKKGKTYETLRLSNKLDLIMYQFVLKLGKNDYYVLEEFIYE